MSKQTKEPWSKTAATLATISFSLIATTVSVFTYFKVDSTLQAFKYRARFQVSIQPTDNNIAFMRKTDDPTLKPGAKIYFPYGSAFDFKIIAINVGNLPAKDTLITAQYYENTNTQITAPTFVPPIPTDVTMNGNTQFIVLKRPIAPLDKITFSFPGIVPRYVWVSSDSGETSTVVLGDVLYTWDGAKWQRSEYDKPPK